MFATLACLTYGYLRHSNDWREKERERERKRKRKVCVCILEVMLLVSMCAESVHEPRGHQAMRAPPSPVNLKLLSQYQERIATPQFEVSHLS